MYYIYFTRSTTNSLGDYVERLPGSGLVNSPFQWLKKAQKSNPRIKYNITFFRAITESEFKEARQVIEILD